MTRTLFLKGLGLLSATTLLFGCPDPEPFEPVDDMGAGMTADMNGGGSTDMGGGTNTDMGGGTNTDMGGTTSPPTTLAEAVAQERVASSDLFCELLFTCTPEQLSDLVEERIAFSSRQDCKQNFFTEVGLASYYAEAQLLDDAGKASFDASAAQTCLTFLRSSSSNVAMTCQDIDQLFENYDAACSSYFSGKAAQDEACVSSLECIGEDSFCNSSDDSCVGVCDTFGGRSCDPECADDSFCDADNSCVPYATQGQSCEEVECSPELFCDYDEVAETLTCQPRKVVGEACFFGDCQDDLFCDDDTMVCTAYKMVGEACVFVGECVDDALCNEDAGICEPLGNGASGISFTVAQDGAPCFFVNDTTFALCAEGLYCVGLSDADELPQGTCSATAKMTGEGCVDDVECGAGLFCDFSTETCAPFGALADGQPCDDDEACTSLYCDPNTEMCASTLTCTMP